MTEGLSDEEGSRRLISFGANQPVARVRGCLLTDMLRQFGKPLVVILLLASLASAALGEFVNASIVFVIVIVSAVLEFVQTYQSHRVTQALESRVAHTAEVHRDGAWRAIPRREVVPGDLLRLDAGDMVAADAQLLETKDLHLNEAALTGESLPVEKGEGAEVFMGSSVVSGRAVATVTRTGPERRSGSPRRLWSRSRLRPSSNEVSRASACSS
ncbi:hypothetical protein LZC95_35535 [Pendulispora brunnea]|uniref:Cation-transporting P-type ATPase N-terminal domain-containing protein n=1 Tax=Pendulispora brunnea TaxID=2905690 RepID=A0ABZ2JZ48_9BACT